MGEVHRHAQQADIMKAELHQVSQNHFNVQYASSNAMTTSILVIDDHDVILRLVQAVLSPHYQVTAYRSSEQALQALATGLLPDLIICDIAMPGMDGFAMHHQLRTSTTLRGVPFIYLSAFDERTHFRQAMKLGADDYLSKPFHPKELLETVQLRLIRKDTLQQPEEERSSVMTIRSLGGFDVHWQGQRLEWQVHKAAVALLYLLKQQQPVTSEDFQAALWSETVSANSISKLLSRLRSNLKDITDVVVHNKRIALQPPPRYLWDATTFAHASQQALEHNQAQAIEQALSYYQGDFMVGFDTPWTRQQQSYYAQLYLRLLEKRCEQASDASTKNQAQRALETFLER